MTSQPHPDDDDALDPAAMLDLLEQQQRTVSRRMAGYVPAILGAWGIAWLVGFGLLWGIDGARPAFAVPLPVAVVCFIVLMVAAIAVAAVLGTLSGRGIRTTPAAAFTGVVYGLTWPVGLVGIFALGSALVRNGMPPELSSFYYPSAISMFVGIMYLIAGALWQARAAVAMGAWIVLVAAVAPFFGYPTHYLVFAVAGGGVFIVGAIVVALYAFGDRRSARGGHRDG